MKNRRYWRILSINLNHYIINYFVYLNKNKIIK